MAETRAEILTGAFVLAAAVGFVLYAAQGRGIVSDSGTYDLNASFRSAEGITVGTDVRLAGVKVGTVTRLDLNPQTFFADATVALRRDLELPDDSAILVASEGLLGGAFIELMPGGSPTNYAPGDEIEDTQGAVSVIALLMKFAGGSSGDAAATDGAAGPAADPLADPAGGGGAVE